MDNGPPRRTRSPSGGNSATYLALFGLVISAFTLIGISALVLPQIAGLVAVIAAFASFILFQYLLWGRWMSGIRVDEDDESQP